MDCNDVILTGGAAVNPNMAEITGDGIDQDCNGADATQQRLKFDMKSAVWTQAGPIGTVLWSGDTVSIHPGGSVSATGPWGYSKGRTHVILDVHSASVGCSLVVVNASNWPVPGVPKTVTTAIPAGAGILDFDLGLSAYYVAAPRPINSIKLSCTAGDVVVDFLTLQDGSDVLAPVADIGIDWSDTDMPGGGYETTVVRSTLLLERKESGGTWSWSASTLPSADLQSLDGMDVVYQYASTGGTLWYASSGTYQGEVTW